MTKWKERVSLFGQMEECMRVTGPEERKMVMVSIIGVMVRFTLENSKTMSVMVKESCTIQMARDLKVFGRRARRVENVDIYGLMVQSTMSFILKERSMEMEIL